MARMKEIVIDVDVNRVIEANRVSFAEKENDILRRLLLERPISVDGPSISAVTQLESPSFGSRQRGIWQVRLGDEVVAASNLKDAYCNLLRLGHERDALFLDRFSTYKAKRDAMLLEGGGSVPFVTAPCGEVCYRTGSRLVCRWQPVRRAGWQTGARGSTRDRADLWHGRLDQRSGTDDLTPAPKC